MKALKLLFYLIISIYTLQLIDWSFLDISFIFDLVKEMPTWFQLLFNGTLIFLALVIIAWSLSKYYFQLKENQEY